MLSVDEIYASLFGAWRLMFGKSDGLRLLDLSADGFWNSFFAIAVAAPAMIVGWVGMANVIADPDAFVGRFGMLGRLAVVEIGTWVLPLFGLALVASRIGLGGRFVQYVVAYNWSMAIAAWVALPGGLLSLFIPFTDQFVLTIMLLLFVFSQVLMWRMTNPVIGRGAAIGTAVFFGMFVTSQLVSYVLQVALGITMPAMPVSG